MNKYKYLHWSSWQGQVPQQFLPDVNTGELVSSDIRVFPVPPGNHVVSYLDVVLPDSTPEAAARNFLLSLKWVESNPQPPVSRHVGLGWFRFDMSALGVPALQELGALTESLVRWLYPFA